MLKAPAFVAALVVEVQSVGLDVSASDLTIDLASIGVFQDGADFSVGDGDFGTDLAGSAGQYGSLYDSMSTTTTGPSITTATAGPSITTATAAATSTTIAAAITTAAAAATTTTTTTTTTSSTALPGLCEQACGGVWGRGWMPGGLH